MRRGRTALQFGRGLLATDAIRGAVGIVQLASTGRQRAVINSDLIMLVTRTAYCISHLCFLPSTIPHLQKYASNSQALRLINLDHPAPPPPLLTRLLSPKPHAELLELYLRFLAAAQPRPPAIAYQSIEENLRSAALGQLRQHQCRVSVARFKVLQSTLLEERVFRGVFIHRKLNLPSSCYETTVSKGAVTFSLKKSQRSQAMQQYERLLRAYQEEGMQEVYCASAEEFLREGEVRRGVFRVVAEVGLGVEGGRGGGGRGAGGGASEHLLQVESVFNRGYNQYEHFLTDLDFLLGGNYFLPPG